ncbi:c-type cytochrome [Desulfuromonas versatilis]|uniref:C-type cytochrome n=1 Tax=Desulfuromonas versatilis TaxID=2802975 RepID=A0ABM9SE07_9BACT|nr:CxxxxCH/CxxCH domain-containing protein [Desulfuromonas versatilis]BCR03480.1 c-type cytochrome [Desulfuromonas versatilis]
MKATRLIILLATLLSLSFLAACGGGGSSSSGTDATTGAAFGVAVDPYIQGAVFQEIGQGGEILQAASYPSDATGRFKFPKDMTPGSIIQLSVNQPGYHDGNAYQGMLKRKFQEGDSNVVVSPLTTLVASGVEPAQVLAVLQAAGLEGLTEADLDDNPMGRLEGVSGDQVSDAQLKLLQANMAVNTLIEKVKKSGEGNASFDFNAELQNEISGNSEMVGTLVQSMRDCLNPQNIQSAYGSLANMVSKAVEINNTIAGLIKEPGQGSQTLQQKIRDAVQQAIQNAQQNPPAPAPALDGAAIYDAQCAGCHRMGSHDTRGNLDLAGKGDLIPATIQGGHMGKALSAEELAALASWVDGGTPAPAPEPTPAPTPEPTPVPVDGQALYTNQCASCHNLSGDGTFWDLSNDGTKVKAKYSAGAAGHQGKIFTAEQIQAIADHVDSAAAPAPTPTPEPTPVDGTALYGSNCANCHGSLANSNIQNRTAAGIQAAIDGNLGSMGFLTLSGAQVQAIADVLPALPAPAPAPVDGQALYTSRCSGCHKLGAVDTTGGPDLAALGNTVISKIQGGHQGVSLSTAELDALADYVDTVSAPAPAPAPTPTPTPVSGQSVYDNSCAACHKLGAHDTAGGPELAGLGNAVFNKIQAGHQGIALSSAELNALADYVDTIAAPAPAPAPTPTPTPVSGQSVYDNSCAACHKLGTHDTAGGPELAGIGDTVFNKIQAGHQGIALGSAELNALADYVDTFPAPAAPGPDYSNCTACHGQPPSGSNAGAHAAHTALPSIGTNCAVCHQSAGHNGTVDLAFASTWSAKSGAATDNGDGTCSNISCHGGQKTPDWYTGTIAVNTDCAKCHTRGTSQYNSQNSGDHSKHSRYSCTTCHDTSKLATNHFTNLGTSSMEGPARNTLNNSLNYNGTSCAPACHGSERW